jgi:hypothetical protein
MNFEPSASGGRRLNWSWNRLVTNMIPNMANSGNPEFSPEETDTVFDFQITNPQPKKLTPSTFYITNITPHQSLAEKTYKRLIKESILTEDPPAVDTKKIGKNMLNQFSFLPIFSQKKLVCLLFLWEEELMRWRILEEEEAEIKTVLAEERSSGGHAGELEKRLLELEGLKKLKPSMRSSQAQQSEALPSYSAT